MARPRDPRARLRKITATWPETDDRVLRRKGQRRSIPHQIYQGRRHEPAFAELAFDELLGVSGVITVRLNRFTHSGLLILGFPAHLKDGLTPV